MNIFQFLGLPENHRKLSNKVTQLVKHWDEVVAKNKVDKHFVTQVKRDGVCTLTVIWKGETAIFSRTGNRFTNTEQLISKIIMLNLPDGIYLGEMWVPKSVLSLEQLSGMVNPNRIKPLDQEFSAIPYVIRMSWFDMVTIKAFTAGYDPLSFGLRHKCLMILFKKGVKVIGGFHPDIDVLGVIHHETEEDIKNALDFNVSVGEEGIVIRDYYADWMAGHKGRRVMKMVRGVDYDLRCIGWEEGSGKYKGKVANLIFAWKGTKTIKCMLGKGWTHQNAEDMFKAVTTGTMDSPINKVFQVYALEESSKGKLRLPKVGEQRFDKDNSDV